MLLDAFAVTYFQEAVPIWWGVWYSVVLPEPNWPEPFWPQHHSVPSVLIPQL